MESKPEIKVVLRGHVRSSLGDSRLRDLISCISDRFKVSIYAHAWGIVQNSLSWREVSEIKEVVNAGMLFNYLSGFEVKSVAIDDDSSISHLGNIQGNIGRTNCPILGWKNMYWGKIAAVRAMCESESPDSIAVQMRFDILSNPFSPDPKEILDFIERDYGVLAAGAGDERLRFLRMHCFVGVDNIYMARANDMLRFMSYMYNDMDRILHFHRGTIFQEHIAFHERMSWWNWPLPGEPMEGSSS